MANAVQKWHAIKNLPQAQLSKPQVKLLLRGDGQLQKKIINVSSDTQACDLFRSAAKRYGITFDDWRRGQSTPPQTQTPSYNQDQSTDGGWQQVRKRASTRSPSRKNKQGGDTVNAAEQEELVLQLLDEDWGVPVLSDLKLGCSGVLLAKSQQHAETLQHSLRGAQSAIAIVTLAPLVLAKRTTQTTFRARVTRSKTTQERLLTGYVNQFGPQGAAHLFVVPQLAPAPNVQRTLALYAE
eukprot:2892181-Amphidinium_carterae.1